jgi:hypothetical protein
MDNGTWITRLCFIAFLKRSRQDEKDFPAGYTVSEETAPYILDHMDES